MSVSYDIFTNAFLSKVTEYNFIPMDPHDRNSVIDGYMKRACAQFNRLCEYDLTDFDDVVREFNVDIPEEDIDEIADIVSEGMLAQWMRPYFYRAENLENRLSTSFDLFSCRVAVPDYGSLQNGKERLFQYDEGVLL